MFGASSDLLWDLRFPEIPSRGFLLVLPRWGLLCLFICAELHISPLGVYYNSTLLGNYMNLRPITLLQVGAGSLCLE